MENLTAKAAGLLNGWADCELQLLNLQEIEKIINKMSVH